MRSFSWSNTTSSTHLWQHAPLPKIVLAHVVVFRASASMTASPIQSGSLIDPPPVHNMVRRKATP
jgi:hypothetical protein